MSREPKPKDMVYGAIKGMLETLDPHSAFMPPETYKEMQEETRGRFEGIGIEITIKDGVLTVVSPIEDTPAFKAGILAGDQILKIEGEPTKNMSLMDAVKRLRGPKGTKVTITIMREGFAKPQEFTLFGMSSRSAVFAMNCWISSTVIFDSPSSRRRQTVNLTRP